MAISSQNDKLIVAIYGGGVTCATLSQALKDQIHLDVQYFDPNPDPTSVITPFLSLYPQAHDALAFIGKEAGATVEKIGWFAEAPSLVVMVSLLCSGCVIEPSRERLTWAHALANGSCLCRARVLMRALQSATLPGFLVHHPGQRSSLYNQPPS